MGSKNSARRSAFEFSSVGGSPGMTGEFYGLFALSGRATAWMAPTAIGIITTATQSNRLGVACVLFFLVLGFCLLWRVREERAAIEGGVA